MELLTFAFVQVVGKAHLCEFGGLIGFASEVLDRLQLEGFRLDTDDLAGVKSVRIQLLEIGGLEDHADRLVQVLFLFDGVAQSIGYTARFCNAEGLAELAGLAVGCELGVRLALRLSSLVYRGEGR